MKMFTMDIMKIPRPERSGVISVLIFWVLLTGYFDIVGAHGGGFSLACWLAPWVCFDGDEGSQSIASKPKRYHYIALYSGPEVKGKKPCTCHVDTRYFDKAIQHLRGALELACDSDKYLPEEWTPPPEIYCPPDMKCTGVFFTFPGYEPFRMSHGEGEYRLHCE